MISVILKKVESTHANLRTPVVRGFIKEKPALNKELIVLAEPLNPAASGRMIRTTRIKQINVLTDKITRCLTSNSIYEIEYV